MAKKKTPEEVKILLKTVFDHFDQEDRSVREFQLRQWKKLKCYWDSLFRIYWSSTAHDYRVYDLDNSNEESNQDDAYDKPVNIFKADLETIIAALSVQIPGVKAYPDDADNPSDLETAKAADNIAKILYRHNDVPLLWLHALFIYCTEGLICGYTKTKSDDKYGKYTTEEYQDVEESIQMKVCPICQTNIVDEDMSDLARDEFDPQDAFSQNMLNEGDFCPECLMQVVPEIREEKMFIPRLVGITSNPKSRQCMEVYGGLFVKVAIYAKEQKDTPYLEFSRERHYTEIIEDFPELNGKFDKDGHWTGASAPDFYETWARLSTQYRGDEPENLVTQRSMWLRPCAFNILPDNEDVSRLKKLYPNGCKVTFVQDEFAEACNEDLDDHWTLSKNPLADYLHHQPLGQLLCTVQEITNDLISLTLQTIEHGIPQTFFDQAILDGQVYSQSEIRPGMMVPVKVAAGKSVSDGFYEIKTATLSGEVLPFAEKTQQLGQFVSGAMPSLFGGAAEGSKTAAEYSMSRAQALQRLQTPWKMLSIWWKHSMAKSINGFIKNVAHDERIVEKDKSGNFINIFVRRTQLVGKIGDIELETAEQLPVTWGQNKDAVLQLMQSQNPALLEALTSPENLPMIADAIGLPQFKIPGENQRIVQQEEIRELLNSAPKIEPEIDELGMPVTDPMTGQPVEKEVPSVDIEPLVDDDLIHSDVCREFLISPQGRLAKVENPKGYKNILLHMERHVMKMQALQAMNMAQAPVEEKPNTEPKEEANV